MGNKGLIGVIGHPYALQDPFLNMGIFKPAAGIRI